MQDRHKQTPKQSKFNTSSLKIATLAKLVVQYVDYDKVEAQRAVWTSIRTIFINLMKC